MRMSLGNAKEKCVAKLHMGMHQFQTFRILLLWISVKSWRRRWSSALQQNQQLLRGHIREDSNANITRGRREACRSFGMVRVATGGTTINGQRHTNRLGLSHGSALDAVTPGLGSHNLSGPCATKRCHHSARSLCWIKDEVRTVRVSTVFLLNQCHTP